MPPCPHFDLKIVQRSKRQSAVAAAAYQSGERLFSEYDQKQKYYSHKSEIVHTEIMLETMELPACPETGACHTEGYSHGAASRPYPGLLPGVFCFQRHDCRLCHP